MNPLISVIVPVYNVEKYLNQCIDSILAQTCKDFELILVDDGSKDMSGELCDEYARKDTRIRVFHKKNGGVSSARNCGLDKAQGEYVCFVDSDDWVEATYLEDMAKYKDYDLVMQGMKQANRTWKYPAKSFNDIRQILNALIEYGCSHDLLFNGPSCKLYKSCIISSNNIRFNDEIWLGEDYLFNLSYIGYIRNACIIDTYSYNYRLSPTSLTHKYISTEDLLFKVNTFKNVAKKISVGINYPAIYDFIIGGQIESLFRKCYRIKRSRKERIAVLNFFKNNATSNMFQYMSMPYSKLGLLSNLPLSIGDGILVLLFAIMNKIKKAPKH